MTSPSGTFNNFLSGLALGALLTAIAGTGVLVLLHVNQVLTLSLLARPGLEPALNWIAANLGLSVIPFALVLILFGYSLVRVRRLLNRPGTTADALSQADHLLDIWTNLFFGIGVIWTAVGMRSALIQALGGLDPETASRLGAFAILQRLVDGGILLALSTTIFGAVGGYCLRVIKSLLVGRRLHGWFQQQAALKQEATNQTLEAMEAHLRSLNESRSLCLEADSPQHTAGTRAAS